MTSKRITNCLETSLHAPLLPQKKQERHLYLVEILSHCLLTQKEKIVRLEPYDILLGQSFENLKVTSSDRSPLFLRFYSLHFELPNPLVHYTVGDNAIIHDLMNEVDAQSSYILFSNLSHMICHAYLDAMENLDQLSQEDTYVSFQQQKVAGLLFTELLRDHTLKISKSVSQFPTSNVKYASKDSQSGAIMKYVADNIHQITLKDAASHFSYQPNYFSRLCQELFHISFNELKLHIRMEIAKEQLGLTTKSIDLISQELGYKAISNFHRNFKQEVGMTPNEYRKQRQDIL